MTQRTGSNAESSAGPPSADPSTTSPSREISAASPSPEPPPDSPIPEDSAQSPATEPAALDLTIGDAQRAVDTWIRQFDEGYWPPLSNLARLIEEVGELARELNHRYGHKPKKPDEPEQDLALELGDILFVLIALANEQNIDLADAFSRVLDKYEVRDASRWRRDAGRQPSVGRDERDLESGCGDRDAHGGD